MNKDFRQSYNIHAFNIKSFEYTIPIPCDNIHKTSNCANLSLIMKYHHNRQFFSWLRKFISGPLILMMLPPLLVLDVFLEIYHRISFPLLGIPLVPRWDYIRIDRHKLSYLTPAQKIFCAYCGYANGLLPYAAKIAAESERYWCAIMHKTNENDSFIVPPHHKDFIPYGDKDTYEKEVENAKKGM